MSTVRFLLFDVCFIYLRLIPHSLHYFKFPPFIPVSEKLKISFSKGKYWSFKIIKTLFTAMNQHSVPAPLALKRSNERISLLHKMQDLSSQAGNVR